MSEVVIGMGLPLSTASSLDSLERAVVVDFLEPLVSIPLNRPANASMKPDEMYPKMIIVPHRQLTSTSSVQPMAT